MPPLRRLSLRYLKAFGYNLERLRERVVLLRFDLRSAARRWCDGGFAGQWLGHRRTLCAEPSVLRTCQRS